MVGKPNGHEDTQGNHKSCYTTIMSYLGIWLTDNNTQVPMVNTVGSKRIYLYQRLSRWWHLCPDLTSPALLYLSLFWSSRCVLPALGYEHIIKVTLSILFLLTINLKLLASACADPNCSLHLWICNCLQVTVRGCLIGCLSVCSPNNFFESNNLCKKEIICYLYRNIIIHTYVENLLDFYNHLIKIQLGCNCKCK